MSYNDVLNYSIGISEFLYKNGVGNIDLIYYYNDPGIPIFDQRIAKTLNCYTEYTDVAIIKEDIFKKFKYKNRLYFAANEPNFNMLNGFDIFNAIGENSINVYKKSLHDKSRKLTLSILVSDYNHTTLQNYANNNYNNINIIFFFFQGYLAYQWYRQYKHYKSFDTFTYKFNSMSRLIDKMRSYRLYLTSKFSEYNPLDQGQVSCSWSCPYTENTVPEILDDQYCFLNNTQKEHINQHLLHNLPLRFDKLEHDTIPNSSYEIDWHTMGQSFLHVVNETVFFADFVHLTEKTFKPIVCQRPFILTSTPGSLAFLKRYGFKTFDKWIDESYDNEQDQHKRLDMIAEEVHKICSYSIEELHQMYEEMKPILEHNRNVFFNEMEDGILQELLDNFNKIDSIYQSKF